MASLPEVYLARHGETAWTLTGQHTGRTDISLTARGELNARSLAQRLTGVVFARVLTSPLARALRTCELAGFGGHGAMHGPPVAELLARTIAGRPDPSLDIGMLSPWRIGRRRARSRTAIRGRPGDGA